MRKIFFYVMILSLFLSFSSASIASDLMINGSVRFKCNFISKYMEKNGYYFIGESFIKDFKTNIFAAKDAEIIVKNKYDAVMGTDRTDIKGNFSISVPRDNNYKIVVRFQDREAEYIVPHENANNFIADLGYFRTEVVAGWLPIPRLTYCYTCDIRYLEMHESL